MPARLNCFVTRFVLWLVTLALFPVSVTVLGRSFEVEVLQCITPIALPLERPLSLAARITARLVESEAREPDAWYRDDYRIARVTVGFARRGSPIPHIEATFAVLGCHPDQVFERIMARRRAILGAAYDDFFTAFCADPPAKKVRPSSPRKPARSVTLEEFERRNKAA